MGTILGVCFIQVREVHTHPPFFVGLFYHYYVGQPVEVVNFAYKLYFLQLVNLFCYGLVLFLREHSLLLTDMSKRG